MIGIRLAKKGDLGLLLLNEAQFATSDVITSTPKEVKRSIKSKNSFVIKKGDRIVAYCLSYYDEYLENAYIEKIVVAPDYRKQGMGRALLLEAIKGAQVIGIRRIVASIQPSNEISKKTFTSQGFENVGMKTLFKEKVKRSVYVKTL